MSSEVLVLHIQRSNTFHWRFAAYSSQWTPPFLSAWVELVVRLFISTRKAALFWKGSPTSPTLLRNTANVLQQKTVKCSSGGSSNGQYLICED